MPLLQSVHIARRSRLLTGKRLCAGAAERPSTCSMLNSNAATAAAQQAPMAIITASPVSGRPCRERLPTCIHNLVAAPQPGEPPSSKLTSYGQSKAKKKTIVEEKSDVRPWIRQKQPGQRDRTLGCKMKHDGHGVARSMRSCLDGKQPSVLYQTPLKCHGSCDDRPPRRAKPVLGISKQSLKCVDYLLPTSIANRLAVGVG